MFEQQHRALIRKKIRELLIGRTSAGSRVDANIKALEEFERYPYIETSTPVDASEFVTNSVIESEQELTVVIDITTASADGVLFDELDEIAMQVEHTLMAESTLGGLVPMLVPAKTHSSKDDEGAYCIGRLSLQFVCQYTKNLMPNPKEKIINFQDIKIQTR